MKRVIKRFLLLLLCFIVVFSACKVKTNALVYQVVLETITRGDDKEYNWSHARSAVIQSDTPIVVTTLSKTLKSGSDVYHDLYEIVSRDLGETWIGPSVIEPLKIYEDNNGYRSLADMWPQWHSTSGTVLNIGTAPFYTDNKTHDGSKKEVVYAVFDPESNRWSSPRQLKLPERDHEDLLLMAPAAGSSQWLELENGDILLPIFYFKISETEASSANRETFSVNNLMRSSDLGFATTIMLCSFDGEQLIYKKHGDELTLNQGRGVYEPSITFFKDEYFLTMRSDKSAYVAKSSDGLYFSPMKEWTFDDDAVLGSYNTQQHWVTHSDALYLVYTRKGANNDEVFRHRAPLFMAEVDAEKLQVLRNTEQIIVPNRGVGLGNFGITDVNEKETWVTVAEYMRNETNVEADNSLFIARIKWKRPNKLIQVR